MPDFIGLDYGSTMIKAAATPAAATRPSAVILEGDDPYLPAAVWAAGRKKPGWPAYLNRRESNGVVFGERDRLLAVGAERGGVTATGYHRRLFAAVHDRLRSAVLDFGGVAISVPDHCSEPRWAIAVGCNEAGLPADLFVREWAAALAASPVADADEAFLLSAGVGPAWVTHVTHRDGTWEATATRVAESVSGLRARQLIADPLGEECIQSFRRDPREDAEADQLLYDGIDSLLCELQHRPDGRFRGRMFGEKMVRPLTREDVANLCPFESELRGLLGPVNGKPVPILAWGEMAKILPLDRWLANSALGGVRVLDADAVASGAAILRARAADPGWAEADCFATVRSADGRYRPAGSEPGSGATPVLEKLPAGPRAAKRKSPWLEIRGNPSQRRVIAGESFRLGRNPTSDWAFDSERFPGVSGAHAVIFPQGGGHLLRDLNSTNGTFVNGERVMQVVLANGDEIRLGDKGPRLIFRHE